VKTTENKIPHQNPQTNISSKLRAQTALKNPNSTTKKQNSLVGSQNSSEEKLPEVSKKGPDGSQALFWTPQRSGPLLRTPQIPWEPSWHFPGAPGDLAPTSPEEPWWLLPIAPRRCW